LDYRSQKKKRSFARVGSIRTDDFDENEKNKIAEEESGKWRIIAETKIKVSEKIRTEGVKLTKWFPLALMEPSEQKQTYSAECLLDLNFLNKKKSEEQKRKVSAFADEILKKFKEIWNSEAFQVLSISTFNIRKINYLQKRRETLRLAIERAEAARRNFLLQNLYIHGPMSSVIPFIQIGYRRHLKSGYF